MNLRKKIAIAFTCMAVTFCVSAVDLPVTNACTLFSAAGSDYVQGGGTLIVKNRDAAPSKQYLKLVTPKNAYRYYGIFIEDNPNGSFRGGINEKGLVVISATASSISAEERKALGRFHSEFGVTDEHIISKFATVDEVLKADKKMFYGPQYTMIADKEKIAIIEGGPDGSISVRETRNGVLTHTNHFVNPEMLWANNKVSDGSKTRLARITELVGADQAPFTIEDFIRFSEDRNAGPNDSVYRDGVGNNSQTLANIIVHIPAKGSPELYIKYRENADEKGKEKITRINADEVFKK